MDDRVGDAVYEAYFGGMGEKLAILTRERIHWICERAVGQRVIDIGCSQGIASILIAREGREVVGIDVDAKSIAFAKEALKKESLDVQRRIQFLNLDFLSEDFTGRSFDTVIMSEVLEHLIDPRTFLEKAIGITVPAGKILITVPFGINDAPDHKRTYYGFNLVRSLVKDLSILDANVVGNSWLCLECRKDVTTSGKSLDEMFEFLETELYHRERALTKGRGARQMDADEAQTDRELADMLQTISRDTQNLASRFIRVENQLTKYSRIEEQLDALRADVADSTDQLDERLGKIVEQSANLSRIEEGMGSLRADMGGTAKQTDERLELLRAQFMEGGRDQLDSLVAMSAKLENMSAQANKGAASAHDLQIAVDGTNELVRNHLAQQRGTLEDLAREMDRARNDANRRDAVILTLRDEAKAREARHGEALLRNKELETKLNLFNPKYSKCLENCERLKKEKEETRARLNATAERLTKEIREEERILSEYTRVNKERDKLKRKNEMFERSRTGKVVKFVWGIFNRIKGYGKK
jgi:SAM-dependent methyltransferase